MSNDKRIRAPEDDPLVELLEEKKMHHNENIFQVLQREVPELEQMLAGDKDEGKKSISDII